MKTFIEAREFKKEGVGMRMSVCIDDIVLFTQNPETNKTLVVLRGDGAAYLLDCDYDSFRDEFNVLKVKRGEN